MSLRALGWNAFFKDAFARLAIDGLVAARVATQHRGGYEVWTADAILTADVPGRFRHQARSGSDYPAVGDWVAIAPIPGETRAVIHAVLPRRTRLARNAPGDATEEQILVTNVDDVFILEALATPPNVRRLERFLTVAAASGAQPTIVLTKADLCANVPAALATVSQACSAAPVLAISAQDGSGIRALRKRITQGHTVVLLGRSGAGKSTLINHLAGEETQFVLPVREDDQKGRHATTGREMVFLPGGGVIIDTPGLRELQLWDGADGLDTAFPDIEALAPSCRFTNCRHLQEPGCAVRAATQEGRLDPARLAAFHKLMSEASQFEGRRAARLRADERRRSQARTQSPSDPSSPSRRRYHGPIDPDE
jgi:ribosome biogenesis GTPase